MNTPSNVASKYTLKNTTVIASALLAGLFSVVTAFQMPVATNASVTGLQTVSISAKRMSAAEKIAFDREDSATQMVVISARRLTAEQKLAMIMEERNAQQLAAQKNLRLQKNG